MASAILNRRARRDYEITDVIEAGIELSGSEVKSLRLGKASIGDSYADPRDGEMWLINCHISEYSNTQKDVQHSPLRARKLLLHKKQINKLSGSVNKKGFTLVVLKMYFNNKGYVKVEIGLGKGKKLYDKRATEKRKDWERQKQRLMREKV